jgi:hypothetical protein
MPLSQIVSASIEDGAVAPVDLSSVAQYTGFKNRIINGAMQFAQRSTSAAMASSTYPSLDRWAVYGGTQGTLSRSSSGLSGFSYAAKIQRNSGSAVTTNLQISQTIESQNMVDLAGQVVTYSFWAKAGANLSSTSSQMYYGLGTGTVADQGGAGSTAGWTGLTYPIGTTNLTITTTWTRYSFQATIPSDALEMVVYLGFFPTGTAGADDSISITGVQLEKGVTATSFDYRPYTTELQLCQRYYFFQNSMLIGTYDYVVYKLNYQVALPVSMRVSPTFTVTSTNSYMGNVSSGPNFGTFRNNTAYPAVGDIYMSVTASSEL